MSSELGRQHKYRHFYSLSLCKTRYMITFSTVGQYLENAYNKIIHFQNILERNWANIF